jgi:hypothetical protein
MDELTRAVYRGFCLVAAAIYDSTVEEDLDVVGMANDLYEELVPPEERLEDMNITVDLGPMDPEREEAFLADLRRRANHDKAARDQEKIARAVAMSDEENIERAAESEEELRTGRG